jgi:hypothetical protein
MGLSRKKIEKKDEIFQKLLNFPRLFDFFDEAAFNYTKFGRF